MHQPTNVRFHVDDVEDTWYYEKKFDFIFSRYMVSSIGDWPKLVKNIYESAPQRLHHQS